MENKTYKDYFFTEDAYIKNKNRTDKKIAAFNTKYMNNAKWKKLFLVLCSHIGYIKYCEIHDFFSSSRIFLKRNLQNTAYKNYIYTDCIDNCLFETGEYAVSYREIEYIILAGRNKQDTNTIKELITKTGRYEWDENEAYVRIIGYR
jgi:hypothetical protein